jgi:hypothetical protein
MNRQVWLSLASFCLLFAMGVSLEFAIDGGASRSLPISGPSLIVGLFFLYKTYSTPVELAGLSERRS